MPLTMASLQPRLHDTLLLTRSYTVAPNVMI